MKKCIEISFSINTFVRDSTKRLYKYCNFIGNKYCDNAKPYFRYYYSCESWSYILTETTTYVENA